MFKRNVGQGKHIHICLQKYYLMALVLIFVSLYFASITFAKEDNWILQGELKTVPSVTPVGGSGSPYKSSSFNASGNLRISACVPIPNPYVMNFNERISWGESFEDSAEYKLIWKAKSLSGTATIDGHTLPSGTWSPEYQTYGRSLVWIGATYNEIEFEYVKLYARDSFFSKYEVSAQWDFKGGLATDATGNGYNGTYTGNVPTNIPGKTDDGLSLNGTSYMTVPSGSSLYYGDENFSVSLWYKTTQSGNYQLIDNTNTVNSKTSGYKLLTSGSNVYAYIYLEGKHCGLGVNNAFKSDGNWHHLALVYDKSLKYPLIIYSDGKLCDYRGYATNTFSTTANPGPLYVGKGGFNGVIDDVTIYKKALSYSEMITISKASPDVTANEIKKDTELDINANGNLLDSSENLNHAVHMDGNVPTFAKSKTEPLGKAVQFNGQNYLSVSNSPSINFGTGDFSVSCWFKTTNTASFNTLIDKRIKVASGWQGYHLCVYDGKYIVLQVADNVKGWYNYLGSSGNTLNDGNWHFVTVTVDRDNTQGVKIYIDGQLKKVDNATIRTGNIDTTANLLIGKHIEGSYYNFIGAIDEVKLFKRALTQKEVDKLYGKKKWNVLLFLNGDNNLEDLQVPKLNDYELTGSTDDINVLVLLDRIDGYDTPLNEKDWTGTKLFYATKDPYSHHFISSQLIKDYGELDMSNFKTLEDFISYCQLNYPAENTLVSISNHGNGITGISQDETSNNSVMSITNAKQALTNARSKTNQKINILLFDACLMQMAEIAYQFRNETDYITGSQETGSGWTLNEKDLYAEFANNASRTPAEVMGLFSQFSAEWTFSGIKTKDNAMSGFVTDFNNFSTLLAAKTDLTDIKAAYAETFKMNGNNSYIDLINFADNVYAKTTDVNIKNSIIALKSAYNNCITFNKAFATYNGKANGLSILYPQNKDNLTYYENYLGYTDTGYDFLANTKWNEFLHKAYP